MVDSLMERIPPDLRRELSKSKKPFIITNPKGNIPIHDLEARVVVNVFREYPNSNGMIMNYNAPKSHFERLKDATQPVSGYFRSNGDEHGYVILDPRQVRLAALRIISSYFLDNFGKYRGEADLEKRGFKVEKPDIGFPKRASEGDESSGYLEGSRSGSTTLTVAQEIDLFRWLNFLKYKITTLSKNLPNYRSKVFDKMEEISGLEKRLKEAKELIAVYNQPLILAMLKKIGAFGTVDEYLSGGNEALTRAIDGFDYTRGFRFSTYACRAILKSFMRVGKREKRHHEINSVSFEPELEIVDVLGQKRGEQESEYLDELARTLKENSAKLNGAEKRVLEARFTLGEKYEEPLTLKQTGEIIGVTKERVRQIQAKALGKLRKVLEKEFRLIF